MLARLFSWMWDRVLDARGLLGAFSEWLVKHKEAIDSVNKVALAIAAFAAPFLVHSIEKRMSGTTLLSQREQAESQLRATMFSDLISPIVGKDSGELDVDREALLTELLALNFSEHFEIKPLLQHVYDRAKIESVEPRARMTRADLRSIARRVRDRQIASLYAEGRAAGSPVDRWTIKLADHLKTSKDLVSKRCTLRPGLTEFLEFSSPDGRHVVTLRAGRPDWDEDTVRVAVLVTNQDEGAEAKANFVVTPFDFPMTDNLRLDDGNRFAVVVVGPGKKSEANVFFLDLVWFPKGYSTPHERPLNFRDYQDLVGKRAS